MDFVEFPIEFHSEVPAAVDELRAEAERRLLELSSKHTDLTGAAIAITAPGQADDGSPIVYQARVVVYSRPEDIAGVKEDDSVEGALKGALSAVERQVREKRQKLGQPWKRADLPGSPGSSKGPEEL